MTPHDIDAAPAFCAAASAAVAFALEQRARQLAFVDPDFDGWPLEDQGLLQALTAFVRLPERRVMLLGDRFDRVERSCPRFVAWRRVWGHALSALRPADAGVDLPTLLLVDRSLLVRVLDRGRWHGQVLVDAPRVRACADEIDALAQRCAPAFGATTLGL